MMAADPNGGYWTVTPAGAVTPHSGAPALGSPALSNLRLAQPIVGMTSTTDGNGYWLVASDGGIFSYGDATFYGSTGGMHLNKPIVGMASTNDGNGLLARRLRRRHLQLRRRHLLRLDGVDRTQQARRRHGRDDRRQRVLARGLRRRHLQLRRRHVLRLHGVHPPEPADRRHGPDSRWQRVLARRVRRRHLHVRRRRLLRIDGGLGCVRLRHDHQPGGSGVRGRGRQRRGGAVRAGIEPQRTVGRSVCSRGRTTPRPRRRAWPPSRSRRTPRQLWRVSTCPATTDGRTWTARAGA